MVLIFNSKIIWCFIEIGLNDKDNESENSSEEIDVDENEDDDMESSEENEKNLDNDMSDLKEDDENFDDEETNKISGEDDNKSKKIFTQKLKEKKVIMDEARKQLPFTFTGNLTRSIKNLSVIIINLNNN